ncbi:DUF7124 domain-containing protein [Halanaeroarchaeum sulfurireducens]|uniref:DUF7124 domain-containing protein n=1 Tax=Halanaeroarchaeum sulfurireducens TaxID=1604004 RepID=A0A0N9N779_9EURY|nr:hypothetical protein [Halanaeroarchaeum sulfurireducens]ALG82924.1 hypothetical protein HLASA_2050 [Halanaeroarchaeum sulfurireducens]
MTRNSTDTPTRLTDGGRPTPGVPDVSEKSTDEHDRSDADDATAESESAERQQTASGRAMPGVPQTGAASTETESSHNHGDGGGDSCGTEESHDETEHDLTTAISLRGLKRAEMPSSVVSDAKTWSDLVGVVGEASGPAMNTYFRKNAVDVDFFNDASQGPADRLARIDEGHHFYSERRVLVGLPEEKEWAEEAGWEFQSFEEVSQESGWTLENA